MMRRLLLALFAAPASICLTGGNLFLLQVAAWGWMVGSYAQEDGLAAALRDTFGGERPCQLCTAIAETKENEESSPLAHTLPDKEPLKLLSGSLAAIALAPPSKKSARLTPSSASGAARSPEPETPPPRA